MKQPLVIALASFGLATAAFAQAPNAGTSPGPHDPNPPMATPDLQLPPPCTTAADLAAAAKHGATPGGAVSATGQVIPIDGAGDTQCSANAITQSAELPGLAPGAQ